MCFVVPRKTEIRQLQFNEDSEMSMDKIHQMLKASKAGRQCLNSLGSAILTELVDLT